MTKIKMATLLSKERVPNPSYQCQQNKGINKIVPAAKEALKEKLAREQAKGLKPRAIRAMCIGIPNVGKSTLMNRLVGKNCANWEQARRDKGQQWLRSGSQLELLDTPGILWPKLKMRKLGKISFNWRYKRSIIAFR